MNKANIRKNYKKNALNEISAATIFEKCLSSQWALLHPPLIYSPLSY